MDCDETDDISFDEIEVERPDYSAEKDDPKLMVEMAVQFPDSLTDDEGYTYQINRCIGNVKYLECSKGKSSRGCLARAIMRDGEFRHTMDHNHAPNHKIVSRCKFNKEFITEAQDRRGRTLQQIYQQICKRLPAESKCVPFKAALQCYQRACVKMALFKSSSVLNADNSKGDQKKVKPNRRSKVEDTLIEDNIEDMKETFDSYNEESEPESGPEPVSELLPGPKGKPLYYDGVGYYFNQTNEDSSQRWLQCAHAACGMFALMDRWEGAPILLLDGEHNHPPNTERRQRICFLHRVKTRHAEEDTPFATIYKEEADENPIGASVFSVETVEKLLKKKTNQSPKEKEPVQRPDRSAAKNKLDSGKADGEPEPKRKKASVFSKPVRVMPRNSPRSKELNAETTQKKSEKLQGPEYFTDLKGHYYYCTRQEDEFRCLRCLVPTCLAEARMSLMEDNAEIEPHPASRPHNHRPDTTTDYNAKLTQMENAWQDSLASERLPSLRVQYCCYHDRRGYYYYQTSVTDNIRYLMCSEGSCGARARMCTLKDAPISISPLHPVHSHPTDPGLREALLFVDAVRARVRADYSPETAITEEAARNIQGALRIDLPLLQKCLEKAAQISKNSFKEDMTEDDVDFVGCVIPAKECDERNHVGSLASESGDHRSKQKWERVPALFGHDWLYHDLNGHYYRTHTDRELACVEPKCGVRAPLPPSHGDIHPPTPHRHPPWLPQHRSRLWFVHRLRRAALKQSHLTFSQIYRNHAYSDPEGASLVPEHEAKLLVDQRPFSLQKDSKAIREKSHVASEKLPFPDLSGCQYYDGVGYYYTAYKERSDEITSRYLRCVRWPQCGGLGKMEEKKGAPIIATARHNHHADPSHRNLCLFAHSLKRRARDEATPLSLIYAEESNKYPDAAYDLEESEVISKLIYIRKMVKQQLDIPTEGVETAQEEIFTDKEEWESETLAGVRRPVYHDGNGYYFMETVATDSTRFLMCAEPDCVTQAKMVPVDGAPIVMVGESGHTHSSDPWRLTALRLLAAMRDSVLNRPETSVEDVYAQHVDKEPIISAQLNKERALQMLDDIQVFREKELESNLNQDGIGNQVEEAGLWDGTEPAQRLASAQHQTWLVHDGRGYYYHSRRTAKREWLFCCEVGCGARGWLDSTPDSVVRRAPGCVLHNHLPNMTQPPQSLEDVAATGEESEETKAIDKYFKDCVGFASSRHVLDEMDENFDDPLDEEMTLEPYQVLYSAGSEETVYTDGRGFYYHHPKGNTQDKQLVKCVMPLCRARGKLVLTQILTPAPAAHSHRPDPLLRHKLVFIENVRRRIRAGGTDIDAIYSKEARRDLIGADMIDEVAVKNLMYKLIKSHHIQEVPVDYVDPESTENTYNNEEVNEDNVEHNLDTITYEEGLSADGFPGSNAIITNVMGNVHLSDDDWECGDDTTASEEPTDAHPRSEKLPSSFDTSLYHDGQGYYFHFDTIKENKMYLLCAEPQCKVKASKPVSPEDAPILPTQHSSAHNHRPFPKRRCQLLLLHRCKLRAASEATPLQDIWQSEAEKDPDTAALVSASHVKLQMKKYREEHNGPLYPAGNNVNVQNNSQEESMFEDAIAGESANKDSESSMADQLDIHRGEVPEKIPALSNETLWHAAGFFYTVYHIVGNLYKAKCVEKGCSARAQITAMPGQTATIRLNRNTSHDHPSNPRRRSHLLFVDRCRRRAADTFDSVDDIYTDETAREPDVASEVNPARVKKAMMAAKRIHMKKFNYEMDKETKENPEIYSVSEDSLDTMEEEDESGQGLSECLLSQTDGALVFHDLHGYFYLETDVQTNTRFLKCIDCEVLAKMATSPLNAAIVLMASSPRHNHEPDMSRLDRIVRGLVSLDGDAEEMPKIELSEDSASMGGDTGESASQNYSDYVTLEDETEEADDPDDPEYKLPLSQSDEKEKLFHDGNGYYYSLHTFKNQKYLQCIGPQCNVVVALGHHDKPQTKLFKTSPHHRHPPDQSRRRRNLFLKNAAKRASMDNSAGSERVAFKEEDVDESGGKARNSNPSELVHGRRPNTFNYHDGHGFYYNSHLTTERYRYLLCVTTTCKARAYMTLTPDNAPINLTRHSPRHNHPPDPSYKRFTYFLEKCKMRAMDEDTPILLIYQQETKLDPVSASKISRENLYQRMVRARSGCTGTKATPHTQILLSPGGTDDNDKVLRKSEAMPGFRPNSTVYHDGQGYYFLFNAFKNNTRYLRCIEPRCRVRASMELVDGAPINVSAGCIHNHRPDFKRKHFVLFLQRCKERAIKETKPIQEIYKEEATSDPESAAMISHQNLIQRMMRARKLNVGYTPTAEDHSEFASACKSDDLAEENSDVQGEAYTSSLAETIMEDNEVSEYDSEADAIEKAITELANTDHSLTVEAEQEEGEQTPSEVLPGIRPHSIMYYDGRGYYYNFNSHRGNIWYLKCIEPQCRVRAHMEQRDGAPIKLSATTFHNHRPDHKRKQFVLWMEETKQRAVIETLPIPTIYAQQAARDPVSASLIAKDNMKTRMYRARRTGLQRIQQEQHSTEAEGEGTDAEEGDSMCLYQPNTEMAGRPTFCDDKGYCYQQTTIRQLTRYLKCLEPGCKAKASSTLDPNTAITLNKLMPAHNHPPNQRQLTMLLDPGQLDSPVQVLYTDENGGERIALCRMSDTTEVSSPIKRPYRQRQQPELTIDPEELVDASTVSEVDVAAGDYYHNEDQQQYPLKPSEVIPGLRPDANNYHDGNGFYYELNRLSQNIRYLKCLMKDCKARAYMEVGKKNSPIVQTNFAKHNHGPDLFRKQFTVFLHRVTRRAAQEDTPINVIYNQEAARDPQSASRIKMENVKQRMLRFRKKHRLQISNKQHFLKLEVADGSSEGTTLYQLAEDGMGLEDGSEYDDGTYYIVEGGEGDMSPYDSYVVSEVEVESTSQAHTD